MARAKGPERPARVGERIRKELMELLLRGEVKDPAVQSAVVQTVRVTADLSLARIYVRSGDPAARPDALLAGLGRAKGFLRRALGAALGLRRVPELTFHWDDTPEEAARVEAILAEVRPPAPDPDGDA